MSLKRVCAGREIEVLTSAEQILAVAGENHGVDRRGVVVFQFLQKNNVELPLG
jgi:hypothetical protein